MSEISPCRFCGSENVFVTALPPYYVAKCRGCIAFGPTASTEEDAIARWNDCTVASPTRTLRDEFARAALTGMLAHSTRYTPRRGTLSNWHEAISEEAYEIADAMMKEREKADD